MKGKAVVIWFSLVALLLAACGDAAPTSTVVVAPTSTIAAAAPTSTIAPVVPTNTVAVAAPTDTIAPAAPTNTVAAATATSSAGDTGATTGAGFPVTIEHKYGSTVITALPQRIVTVGLTEQDALLALGVVPVGTTEWFGGYPGSVWPWAQDKLGGVVPEAVGGSSGISFEKIAALNPDAILALYAGITESDYKKLTEIAPTVAQPGEYVDYGIPWQELTQKVGKVVGQEAQANELVAAVEAKITQARTDHPEFVGASSIVATPYQGIWVYGPDDVRGRFLTSLGFELPAELTELTGAAFGGNLSMERADILDVDAIIWLDPADAEGDLGGPVYKNLKVHTEAREVFLNSNEPLGGATSFVSVLSLPFLLDGIVPMLAAAVDGDTSTVVATPAGAAAPTATP